MLNSIQYGAYFLSRYNNSCNQLSLKTTCLDQHDNISSQNVRLFVFENVMKLVAAFTCLILLCSGFSISFCIVFNGISILLFSVNSFFYGFISCICV